MNASTIQKIEIPQSRKKNLWLLFGSLLFVIASVYMWDDGNLYISIAGFVFFGLGVIVAIIRLIDNRNGIIIDSKGIVDNTTFTSVGLIDWEDVTELKPIFIATEFLVVIYVSNPEKYINMTTNRIKAFSLRRNFKKYGSPLLIANGTLKCKNDEFYNFLQNAFEQYQEAKR